MGVAHCCRLCDLPTRCRADAGGAILWHWTPTVGLVADAIKGIGLVVTLWARLILGGNWSATVEFKERHELIERGPYRVVRHPIYSGVLLMVLGTAILWGGSSA